MDDLYLLTLQRLEAQVSSLKTIDMDWGQLDQEAETYPVLFPCALVEVPEVAFEDTGSPFQTAEGTLRVKVGIDMLFDTNKGSGTQAQAVAKLAPVKAIHNALHRWKPSGTIEKLCRTGYTVTNFNGIKVVEMRYRVQWGDVSS